MDNFNEKKNLYFSSGPTKKYPKFSASIISSAVLNRSHRSKKAVERIQYSLDLTREVLNIPTDYKVAIVPASDTGAFELAMWNLLGKNNVDVIAFDVFGKGWVKDIEELNITHNKFIGDLSFPNIENVKAKNDIVFTYNGTTSGICFTGNEKIFTSNEDDNLLLCDATSSLFAMPMPLEKLDIITFSWQKSLGSEAGFGTIIFSPKALKRLNLYTPTWPIPKIFRIKKDNEINMDLFEGKVLNTISMLCLEDYINTLSWVKDIGGVDATIKKTNENYQQIEDWIKHSNFEFLIEKEHRSKSAVTIIPKDIRNFDENEKRDYLQKMANYLEINCSVYDIMGHRSEKPCLRIWCGPTIEKDEVKILLQYIDEAYANLSGK